MAVLKSHRSTRHLSDNGCELNRSMQRSLIIWADNSSSRESNRRAVLNLNPAMVVFRLKQRLRTTVAVETTVNRLRAATAPTIEDWTQFNGKAQWRWLSRTDAGSRHSPVRTGASRDWDDMLCPIRGKRWASRLTFSAYELTISVAWLNFLPHSNRSVMRLWTKYQPEYFWLAQPPI